MLRVIQERREELIRFGQLHGVQSLDLFGSAADGSFDPASSDLDFLVEFQPCSPSEHYERYFGLLERLEELFGRRIDLVEVSAMRNPYFIRGVNQSRTPIYAA